MPSLAPHMAREVELIAEGQDIWVLIARLDAKGRVSQTTDSPALSGQETMDAGVLIRVMGSLLARTAVSMSRCNDGLGMDDALKVVAEGAYKAANQVLVQTFLDLQFVNNETQG